MCVFWKRSYQVIQPDPPSWRMFSTRYTLRSDHGKVLLFAPPPQPASATPDAQAWVQKLSDKDVGWSYSATRTSEGPAPSQPPAQRIF